MVRVEREDGVALVLMDRPKVNALSPAFLETLDQGLAKAWEAPGTRAVVLASAQERAFSAGFDLKELDRLGPAEFAGFFGAFAR
ncbi:MAG: enoyl-CoA hydratase/isomerase family protein, partial [Deltaproteobacteria bacterium]|nr:enoyl-CoA hydratase/isomerase family protein [Deltaproteobacteria bacterium]